MTMPRITFLTISLACMATLGQTVEPATARAEENMSQSDLELSRMDIRTQKAALIADRMKFTDKEADVFWPVYRKYEVELASINDKKISLLKDYVDHYETLDDKQAKKLTQGVFDMDQRTLDLRTKCFAQLEKVLPAKTVVRWLQLERRLQLLVDSQLAKDLPAIKK
ncbi:MAG TPA: hypothetical protein VH681_13910 [Nitrospiraceae bacterium]